MRKSALFERAKAACGAHPVRIVCWAGLECEDGWFEESAALAEGVCWAEYCDEAGERKIRGFCFHHALKAVEMDLFERLAGDLPEGSDVLSAVRALSGGVA